MITADACIFHQEATPVSELEAENMKGKLTLRLLDTYGSLHIKKCKKVAGIINLTEEHSIHISNAANGSEASDHVEMKMREKDSRLQQAVITKMDKGLMQKGAKAAINHDEQEAESMASVVPTVDNLGTCEDNQRLKKKLEASIKSCKNMEMMLRSLGREKEIMAAELGRKVNELAELEMHLHDLKVQNDMLISKVRACVNKHKENGNDTTKIQDLQERNTQLSGQLLRSLEGYRLLKSKLKKAEKVNAQLRRQVAKMNPLLDMTNESKGKTEAGGRQVLAIQKPIKDENGHNNSEQKTNKQFVSA